MFCKSYITANIVHRLQIEMIYIYDDIIRVGGFFDTLRSAGKSTRPQMKQLF